MYAQHAEGSFCWLLRVPGAEYDTLSSTKELLKVARCASLLYHKQRCAQTIGSFNNPRKELTAGPPLGLG